MNGQIIGAIHNIEKLVSLYKHPYDENWVHVLSGARID